MEINFNTNEIFCDVPMFDANASVIYPHGTKQSIPIGDIPIVLTQDCHNYGYNKIHFFGNEIFLATIISDIQLIEKTKYSTNQIEIEVN